MPQAAIAIVSDESSKSEGTEESSSDSEKEASPEAADPEEEREARKANARAVGLDTAFLDALGDEFEDVPAPAGKYGPGGTLVAENMEELEKVTGLPKTKLPPPPPGLSPKKERDQVLKKDFLQETTPTLELEGKDEGEVLFESAAVETSESERLDLVSGPTPIVPQDEGLPDVLASFDAEAADPAQSGDALVVSVAPGAAAKAASSSDEAAAGKPEKDEDKDEDEDDKKAAVVVAPSKPKPKPEAESKPEPKRAAAATSVAASQPAANDGPDLQKYAVFGLVALLLLFGGYALMSRDDDPKGAEVAKAGAAGKDKAAPAEGRDDEAGDGEAGDGGGGGGGGGAADAADDAAGGGGGGGGDAEEAGDEAAPAGADDAAGEGADEAAEGGGAAGATDAQEAAADAADTEGPVAADSGDADIEIDGGGDDEGGGGGGGGGGVAPISGNTDKKQEREAENEMTAKELREAAQEALKKKRYSDAYRLSGKAIRKESTESAHAIRVEAACGMKNQAAAKSAFDHITTGKLKRDLRASCRTHDVRLGI